jgi:hypothetical protein
VKETDFTRAVAEIGSRNGPFNDALAQTLLKAAIETEPRTAERTRGLLKSMPPTGLRLLAEKTDYNDRWRDIWRRVHRSKYDWLFWKEQIFALAVEVKIEDRTPFTIRQLASHHGALTDRMSQYPAPHKGLLALVTRPPRKADLISIRRNKAFLGALLWSDAASGLRKIPLENKADIERWHSLLDLVC